jgi:cell shape-determining protein MreD
LKIILWPIVFFEDNKVPAHFFSTLTDEEILLVALGAVLLLLLFGMASHEIVKAIKEMLVQACILGLLLLLVFALAFGKPK